jgi:hypothetical protein
VDLHRTEGRISMALLGPRLHRRFITPLSVEECRARARRAFGVLRTTPWRPSKRWERAYGKLTRDGFVMRIPAIPGQLGSVLVFAGVRVAFTPTPDGTRIDTRPDTRLKTRLDAVGP